MTTPETKIAVLESKLADLQKDVDELQKQRNAGVVAVIALVFETAFGVFTRGGQ